MPKNLNIWAPGTDRLSHQTSLTILAVNVVREVNLPSLYTNLIQSNVVRR